jgi:hypothetical protein
MKYIKMGIPLLIIVWITLQWIKCGRQIHDEQTVMFYSNYISNTYMIKEHDKSKIWPNNLDHFEEYLKKEKSSPNLINDGSIYDEIYAFHKNNFKEVAIDDSGKNFMYFRIILKNGSDLNCKAVIEEKSN